MAGGITVLGREDNEALLALVRSCPVHARLRLPWPGTTVLRPDRSPDDFAFLRAMGGEARVLGIRRHEMVIASVSVVRRTIRWHGEPRVADDVGDLRVRPEHRRSSLLHPLLRAVRTRGGEAVPAYVSVLEENEAALVALALGEGVVPPTANLDAPDPACPVTCPREATSSDAAHVLAGSFGFGGTGCALVLSRV